MNCPGMPTAEQWSAFGNVLAGVGAIALACIAVATARSWSAKAWNAQRQAEKRVDAAAVGYEALLAAMLTISETLSLPTDVETEWLAAQRTKEFGALPHVIPALLEANMKLVRDTKMQLLRAAGLARIHLWEPEREALHHAMAEVLACRKQAFQLAIGIRPPGPDEGLRERVDALSLEWSARLHVIEEEHLPRFAEVGRFDTKPRAP